MGLWQHMLDVLGVNSKKVCDHKPGVVWLLAPPNFATHLTSRMLQVCVLVVGLDNGGKSTIVNRLKVGKLVVTLVSHNLLH